MKLDFTEIPETFDSGEILYDLLDCLVDMAHKESENPTSFSFSEEEIANILSDTMKEGCDRSEKLHNYECHNYQSNVSVHSLIVRLDEEVNRLYDKLIQAPVEVRNLLDMNFTRAAYEYNNQLTSVLLEDFMFAPSKITVLYNILGDKYLPDILNNLSSNKTLYNIITDIILGLSITCIEDINTTIGILHEC